MFENKQSSDIAWNPASLNCDPHPRINALSVAAHLLRPPMIGKQIPVDTFHSGDPMRVEEENERILFIYCYSWFFFISCLFLFFPDVESRLKFLELLAVVVRKQVGSSMRQREINGWRRSVRQRLNYLSLWTIEETFIFKCVFT